MAQYLSKDGAQLVDAIQYTDGCSLEKIQAMGIGVFIGPNGATIDGYPIEKGQFAVQTMCSAIAIDSKKFNSRFRPVAVQDLLF